MVSINYPIFADENANRIVKNLVIFASGKGSNAEKIIEYFRDSEKARVRLIVSNKKDALVLDIAKKNNIDYLVIDKKQLKTGEGLLERLKAVDTDWIILAGFLLLIPAYLVDQYPNTIINIHPALLPKFGGKGMYGMHVHEAVKAANEATTGITIHYVNEHYDEGNIIFQASCAINPEDSPQRIAERVRKLEHQHFAEVIDQLLDG